MIATSSRYKCPDGSLAIYCLYHFLHLEDSADKSGAAVHPVLFMRPGRRSSLTAKSGYLPLVLEVSCREKLQGFRIIPGHSVRIQEQRNWIDGSPCQPGKFRIEGFSWVPRSRTKLHFDALGGFSIGRSHPEKLRILHKARNSNFSLRNGGQELLRKMKKIV